MKQIDVNKQNMISRYAKALSHPIRIYVLQLLSTQSCCYSGDLSEELPIAKSTLSQHLKELKEAGLIQGEIEAPRIKYCINKKNWEDAKLLFTELFDNYKLNKIFDMEFNDLKPAKMEIKILGTGCAKCNSLAKATEKAVEKAGINAVIIKVEDIVEIMEYGVMLTPALVVNGKVVVKGCVPKVKEIIELITK